MPAASRRFRRSARMLVGMRSGESASSLYVRLPKYRSRTTSSDHLSPTMSSELATAHGERGKVLAGPMFRVPVVTCILQVMMLRLPLTCKIQVTGARHHVHHSPSPVGI